MKKIYHHEGPENAYGGPGSAQGGPLKIAAGPLEPFLERPDLRTGTKVRPGGGEGACRKRSSQL